MKWESSSVGLPWQRRSLLIMWDSGSHLLVSSSMGSESTLFVMLYQTSSCSIANSVRQEAGAPMMHYQTLDLMARHGVDIMLGPTIEFLPAPTVRQPHLPDDLSPPLEDDLIGQCFACDETGPLYNLCTNCEDSGMIYDKIQSGDDSSASSIQEPIGTCSSCHTTGPVGQPCTCPDTKARYLNFHTGL
jgi:hypothetical protein